jgi:hypothetical protein
MVTLAPISDFHSLRKLNEGETIQSFNCGDTKLIKLVTICDWFNELKYSSFP